MAPFRFRLARVLDWYEKQCALEVSRLHVCSAAVAEVATQIVRIREALSAMESELVQAASASALDLVAMDFYRQSTKRQELSLGAELKKRRHALEAQRAILEAARRRFRLLEKLRERRLSEHTYAEDQELEELAADAFRAASFRHGHGA